LAGKTEQTQTELNFHLNCLAIYFQDPDTHHFFITGKKWISCSQSSKYLEISVSLPVILGVSNENLKRFMGDFGRAKFARVIIH
jgi:hypothetical protein